MKKKVIGILVCMLLIAATALPVAGTMNDFNLIKENLIVYENDQIEQQPVYFDDYVPGEAIVGFYGPLPYFYQNISYSIAQKYDINLSDTNDDLCAALYTDVDEGILIQMLEDPDVKYVGRNYYVEHCVIPNDPDWPLQWGPSHIGAPAAWNCVTGSSTLKVAVVDTGIDYIHPDLSGNYISGGYDWANMDSNPIDDHGHGTHCAGIIGAVGNNLAGIAGMTWNINLIAEKVLSSTGSGTYWSVGIGIVHAAFIGAKIISLSLGGSSYSTFLHQAVQFAYNRGCLLVAASGNFGISPVIYPARFPEVMAIGVIDSSNNMPSWGNYGPDQELVAPGVNIYSTLLGGTYGYLSGTSMACPHVAGTAALIWSANPGLTRDEVRCFLNTGAQDLGTPGWDQIFGNGLVRADTSVSNGAFSYTIDVTPPAQTITPGGAHAIFSITVTDTSLCPGLTPTVFLDIDPFYPTDPNLNYNPSPPMWAVTPTPSGTTVTLDIWADSTAVASTSIHRIVSSCMIGGCSLMRHSNFFTVTVDGFLDDMVWIKTSDTDTGAIPATGRVWKSPWIEPDPDNPEYLPEVNKLNVTVGNLHNTGSTGPVDVAAIWHCYPGFLPLCMWPYVDSIVPVRSIDDIAPLGTKKVTFSDWQIPDVLGTDHICVLAQAYRPLEPRDPSWNVIYNNNVAQRNTRAVYGCSSYNTVLNLENPTNKTISGKYYIEAPNMKWTVTLCIASYVEDGKVVTPFMVPPGGELTLNLTIDLPADEESGIVKIQYIIDGYEHIYPNISYFGFDVRRDKVPPVLEITKPKGIYLFEKEIIPLPWFNFALVVGSVAITANANDEESGVSKVEFYVDDEIISTDFEEPYECQWKNATGLFGIYSIKAIAYDNAENSFTSKEITVLRFL